MVKMNIAEKPDTRKAGRPAESSTRKTKNPLITAESEISDKTSSEISNHRETLGRFETVISDGAAIGRRA